MKRETMRWIRREAALRRSLPSSVWAHRFAEIEAELKRLRRENLELRATCRLAVDELSDVNGYLPASLEPGGHVHEALKKGGQR